jgi:hypothetical protein
VIGLALQPSLDRSTPVADVPADAVADRPFPAHTPAVQRVDRHAQHSDRSAKVISRSLDPFVIIFRSPVMVTGLRSCLLGSRPHPSWSVWSSPRPSRAAVAVAALTLDRRSYDQGIRRVIG